MLQLSKHNNPQSLVVIGVQMCAKMPKEHFIKNFTCIQLPYMRKKKMHEHMKICLKYMLKCHKGPTQITSTQMRLSQINKI